MNIPFPTDWQRAVIFVAHPDDPEYGMAAAVSRWTNEGKSVMYVLASSGEAGIEGMAPEVCGPIREEEQRMAGREVGVDHVDFLGFPDSDLHNTPTLRAAITSSVQTLRPDLVITMFRGAEWAPGAPNQRDHIEFGNAVVAAIEAMDERPRYLFESGGLATHSVKVSPTDVERAVQSLAQHAEYLSVLDPATPVIEQAVNQIDKVGVVSAAGRSIGFTVIEA
ncbi:MAG: PIG-L family deacetylase [Antricoccus sp.]